ncbi:MAG: helix-turn-helix transcriptional regulator [Actinobacteria bacterium]|nr:helix-turn-helix transcriptional regulator [Actinomycetota bacterium]
MARARTGAERYFAERLTDADYRRHYHEARARIAQVDAVIRALDERRTALSFTKAELARRAGVKPEAVRRLFSAETPNPTLNTLVALAQALGLELRPQEAAVAKPVRNGSGTRRQGGTSAKRGGYEASKPISQISQPENTGGIGTGAAGGKKK